MAVTCGWCGKPILTGMYCLYTGCAEKAYEQWKKDQASKESK